MERVATVRRYLDSVARRDWDAVRATLAPDVVRHGPYRDIYTGADAYLRFLDETFERLRDYTMDVDTVWAGEHGVVAEIAEAVTLDGERLRTDEALLFRFDGTGLIAEIRVFLQQSYAPA